MGKFTVMDKITVRDMIRGQTITIEAVANEIEISCVSPFGNGKITLSPDKSADYVCKGIQKVKKAILDEHERIINQ